MFVYGVGFGVWMRVGCPCPPIRNNIVTARHLETCPHGLTQKTDKPQIDQAFYRVASPQLKCGHNWDKALHFPKFYGLVSIPAEKPQRKMAKMPVLKRKCLHEG